MANNKFEKLIEYIINEDEAKAKALFHQIVVDKSRDIYEGLQSREMGVDGLEDDINQHQQGIEGDEFGMHEEEDFAPEDDLGGDEFGGDDLGGDEFGGDEFGGDEFGGDEMGGEEAPIEDRVMDLEDAIDELKAEFDQLMAGEESEEENFPGIHGDDEEGAEDSDFDSDEDSEGELDGELEGGDEEEGEKAFGEASIYGESKEADKKADKKAEKAKADKEKSKKEAKTESRKSPADLMREYVEKVTAVKPVEGDFVGAGTGEAGSKPSVNKKSVQISGKNDMGGTTANIAQGKFASDRDSNTGPKKPSNYLTKGETKMGQDKYENSPAANTKGYKDKQSAKTKEGSTTDGSETVSKKSFNPGGKSGFKG